MADKKDNHKTVFIAAALVVAGIVIGIIAVCIFMAFKNAKEEKEIKAASGSDYDITKCIKLEDYKNLKVSLKATDEDVQSEVDSLLEEYTNYEQKKGTAQDGDMVYADFEGSVDGKVVDTTCGSDYIEIGAGDWLEGFEQAFIGMKTGKSKEVDIAVPEGIYGDDAIDGKTVTFKLTLKYICGESIVPDYNDEFVQSVSDYKTVDEYNTYLKEKLEKENEEDKEEFAWTEVVDKSKVKKYPDSLMEEARQEVLQGYYDMADIYGQSHDEIFQSFGCEDEQDFVDTQLEDLAKDTVKEELVAQAISYYEKINYTQKEYDSLAKDEYESNKDSYESKEEFLKKQKDYLEDTALANAVKNWISKRTKYTK